MELQLDELKAQVDLTKEKTMKYKNSKIVQGLINTSFALHILCVYVPTRFTFPKCQTYDKIGDPLNHLMHFQELMTLMQGSEALMCKAFPSSL